MKEQLPPPEPGSGSYVRPGQNWICGKIATGGPCRIGPDAGGNCRATAECAPKLELKEGETKGRYKCTRPAEYGGACEHGPMPDGSCGRPITRCQPVRSLRSRRKIFSLSVLMATIGLLMFGLGGSNRWRFINPGPLSSQHSGSGFVEALARIHAKSASDEPGCAGCHVGAQAGASQWIKDALEANPGPLHAHTLGLMTTADMTTIDANCEQCHAQHFFHEPNVVKDHSCSACHQEHVGSGLLKKPADSNCEACHGNAQVMEASCEKGKTLPASAFDFRPDNGRNIFHAPRPERGYTQVIHSFAKDHPEFQVLAEHFKDPDTLRFNHKLHLTSVTVSAINGQKSLECADCHKLDAAGHYHQRISFEQNCQRCHSLQFDAHNPQMMIPHGESEFARAFLRSLPAQYAEFGAHVKGYVKPDDIERFVREQMKQIRAQSVSGEELERRVFFGDSNEGRAAFPACSFCHEVKPSAQPDSAPIVTRPVIMDRWLIRGNFDHSKHLNIDCVQCHDARESELTSDVLLPAKASCAECHSPKGGVANGCSTCHNYHAPVKNLTAVNAGLETIASK